MSYHHYARRKLILVIALLNEPQNAISDHCERTHACKLQIASISSSVNSLRALHRVAAVRLPDSMHIESSQHTPHTTRSAVLLVAIVTYVSDAVRPV